MTPYSSRFVPNFAISGSVSANSLQDSKSAHVPPNSPAENIVRQLPNDSTDQLGEELNLLFFYPEASMDAHGKPVV
jgi:hypothetical protein